MVICTAPNVCKSSASRRVLAKSHDLLREVRGEAGKRDTGKSAGVSSSNREMCHELVHAGQLGSTRRQSAANRYTAW